MSDYSTPLGNKAKDVDFGQREAASMMDVHLYALIMAIRVVEFSKGGYKIRNEIIEF